MNGKVPAAPSVNLPYPILGFLQISGNKKWDYVILGVTGIAIIAILVYEILIQSLSNLQINFSPADIVYGEKIHAIHAMSDAGEPHDLRLSPTNTGEGPAIRVSESFYDFGEVDPQQLLTRTFIIANIGQSPLIIKRAFTTCGCTVADFTAAEIPPGKVALMILQFDPGYHDMRGTTVRRGVIIEANDPDQPILEIWVQASIQ